MIFDSFEETQWRRKILLEKYLSRHKRHSIKHIVREWDSGERFTPKIIKGLLQAYPDTFREVTVKSAGRNYPGVALTNKSK